MKAPGTPASTGLIHMPIDKVKPTGVVTYHQVGGFGPVSRAAALEAAKIAGVIGRSRPQKVWVQKPRSNVDATLSSVIALLDAGKVRYSVIEKEDTAKPGFGVYYLYGDKVVMEHTSDPESVVTVGGVTRQYPHVHVEVIPYQDIAMGTLGMSDKIKEINAFKIFDDSGYSPTATRLVRLGVSDPSAKLDKPKFNHHIYYTL